MDTEGKVYLGAWTNWSRGSTVMGATLTLTRQHGNFLIAFTALFVPFVASRFWKISAIIFHQYYSKLDTPRDAIHHQRQVVLRNSTSPESGLMSFVHLLWAWHSTDQRLWQRLLPAVLLSFLSICAFTVGGGLSSQIATTGEVLLNGDNCTIITDTNNTSMAQATLNLGYMATITNQVANYAQQCYTNQGSGLLECSRFITSTLPTAKMDYNAPCPFQDGICRRQNSNVRFDTGHLNSNDVFGVNAPKGDTFTFRYVLQVILSYVSYISLAPPAHGLSSNCNWSKLPHHTLPLFKVWLRLS